MYRYLTIKNILLLLRLSPLTDAAAAVDRVAMVTRHAAFTVRALSEVGTRLVTDAAVVGASTVTVALASCK